MVGTISTAKNCKNNSFIDKRLHFFRFPNPNEQRPYNLVVESCMQPGNSGRYDIVQKLQNIWPTFHFFT